MLVPLLLGFGLSTPFILFDKKVVEEKGKVGEPTHVEYRIYNLGDSAASDLHIDDSGIPLEQWDFPKSANNLKWNSLGPGENLTHFFRAKPLVAGNLRMGSSRLRYVSEGEKKIALSSQLFWFECQSTRSIGAKENLFGYSIVFAVAFASILVPFLLWLLTRPRPPKKVQRSGSKGAQKKEN
jgi:hypothetical protein